MRITTEKLSAGAFRLKDSTVLDLKDLTSDTWFAKKHEFWVQRIEGITQVQNELGSDYSIVVSGIGFGIDQDDRKSKILQITTGGQPLLFRENRPANYLTEIHFSNSSVQNRFQDRRMAILPLLIKVKVSTKKSFGWVDREYELPISLNLMPRFAGSIKMQYSHPVSEWVKTVWASTYPWIKPNCHRGNTKDPKRAADNETVLPDNKIFSGVPGYRCRGAGGRHRSGSQAVRRPSQ